MQLRSIVYAVAVLGTHIVRAGVFDESLGAQGLLGSHFGIPGLPAAFDYVVIGGGTAGLTVARRLAANSSVTVAVIEAGDFYEFSNGNLSQIPAYASRFTGNDPVEKNPFLDWYHYTEPQPALGNRRYLYDSGKVIGGTSGRNFLWQIRGTIGCFDKWAEEVGDNSYRWKDFLPYFQKSYSFTPPNNTERPDSSPATYNASDWGEPAGPVKVGYSSWVNPISSWLGLSFEELEIPNLSSLTGGTLLGWSWLSQTLDSITQVRSSSEEFLREAFRESSNLLIYKSTLAKRIIFEHATAKGVTVDSGGITYNITANKEVILSAGVMRSPQILMVSGIGPKAILGAQGIDVVADRPGVGQNMWDNVLVGPTYAVDVTTHNSLADPEFLAEAIEEYNTNRTGMLTNVGGDVAAFEKLPPTAMPNTTFTSLEQSFPPDWPHIEYLVLDAYFGAGTDSSTGISDGNQYVTASVGLVATFSRGNVSIASPDTAINPIISPNWLSDPRDLDIAIAAFRRGRDLFATQAIKPVAGAEAFPGTNVTTDAQILEVVKASANSVYNAAGTCKMGRAEDSMAVVSNTGRVFEVERLRLVDASAFPFLPPGQPSATVYALAEKIADDIAVGR